MTELNKSSILLINALRKVAQMFSDGGFVDANGRHVVVGDIVEYQLRPGVHATVIDIVQDGDGAIRYHDGTVENVKLMRLARVPGTRVRRPIPVAGYTPQSDAKIALVNEFKADEERLLRKIDALLGARLSDTDKRLAEAAPHSYTADARWASIARTHFQEGFMALNRAVFRPQRIALPEDEKPTAA